MKDILRSLRSYSKSNRYRRIIWHSWYRKFDMNPFSIDPAKISKQVYLDLAAEASNRTYSDFLHEVEGSFGILPDKEFVDELALSTQIVIKKSELVYLHGYLLYGALRHYLATHPDEKSVLILETGTARGFSALCMAKALQDAQRNGKILTIDVLHAQKPIYWNCIHDAEGQKTRLQLLDQWRDLVGEYVVFLRGYTDIVLEQIGLARIHFAFLDGGHDYETLRIELDFVARHQQEGDVIICDDYTPEKFPGLVRAVDELVASGEYKNQLFLSKEKRGYMCCYRSSTN